MNHHHHIISPTPPYPLPRVPSIRYTTNINTNNRRQAKKQSTVTRRHYAILNRDEKTRYTCRDLTTSCLVRPHLNRRPNDIDMKSIKDKHGIKTAHSTFIVDGKIIGVCRGRGLMLLSQSRHSRTPNRGITTSRARMCPPSPKTLKKKTLSIYIVQDSKQASVKTSKKTMSTWLVHTR